MFDTSLYQVNTAVIRIHLISLSYHILVIVPSHFNSMEQMLMLMLSSNRTAVIKCAGVPLDNSLFIKLHFGDRCVPNKRHLTGARAAAAGFIGGRCLCSHAAVGALCAAAAAAACVSHRLITIIQRAIVCDPLSLRLDSSIQYCG